MSRESHTWESWEYPSSSQQRLCYSHLLTLQQFSWNVLGFTNVFVSEILLCIYWGTLHALVLFTLLQPRGLSVPWILTAQIWSLCFFCHQCFAGEPYENKHRAVAFQVWSFKGLLPDLSKIAPLPRSLFFFIALKLI